LSLALAPASHHDILLVLVAFTILLVAARLFGELAGRLGQPPVAGEILAGVVLGPSLLAGAVPALGNWIVPETQTAGQLLEFAGLIGAMFLLLITGMETDIPLIRRHARKATSIAAGGLFLPFAGGLAVAFVVPDSLLPDPEQRPIFTLFLATALAVSAIPVVAKVLLDLGLIRKTFGQTVLAAGMIDDTVAWVLLSVVVALASGGDGGLLGTALAAGTILLFIAVAATIGRYLLNGALAVVQDRGKSPDRVFTLVVAAAFGFGAAAQAIGVEAVLGAFIAGIILGQSPRLPAQVVERLHTVTLSVFSPVFFAIAGLKVSIADLLTPQLLVITGAIVTVAIVGKVAGAYLGARVVGLGHWIALGYGSALNARGAVGIIIAAIGLDLGILSPEMYSVVVVTAVLTSLIAPPMVKWCLSKVPPDPEEEKRLAREEASGGDAGSPRRILVPVRPRAGVAPVHRVAADLIGRLNDAPSVTLLTVAERDDRADAESFLATVAELFPGKVTTRVTVGDDPIRPILDAAAADHDLLVLGAPESTSTADVLFNPVVDDLARLANCPTLIVTGRNLHRVHWPPQRILVPVKASSASRRAAQLAMSIAGDAEVIGLHIVQQYTYARTGASEQSMERRVLQATELTADFLKMGEAYEVRCQSEVQFSASVSDAILAAVEDQGVDLVVLGTNLRPGTTRLHLGHQVETVLQRAPCPVLLLNSSL
jgi:Kef-type K+ transport system membrane component KefB